ncbi:flagellar hook-associated protein 2 [Lederbergia galactosidilyticus]|uniref:flagellar filament capping protein FliD n=1 Tax=Lederbergia galactosidilytica TaxID=217031 RepID=UPI001AE6FE63|nr:flagellar filament capping protein FliD [Lederbergia galactosidilytica]MBP1913317.1 flagellar hook-associated protein 2 [Lederbergia galactosidilytica]
MRIAGLASGMDIDSIVKDLMRAESIPLDKLKQKKQILEWQRDDCRALNTELLSFRDKLAQLKLTTNYRSRTVSSSNEQFVTATVSSGAAQASYSITEVKNLAKAATMVNGGGITGKDGKFDPTKSLKDQLPDGFKWEQGVVESQTLTVDKDGNVPEFKFDGDLKEVNVIVNGRAVKITTDETNHKADEVLVKSDGTLVFGENVKPANGSVVKINYVVNEKTTSKTVGEDPIKTWSLGKGALNTGSVKIEYNGQTYSVTEGNKLKSGDDVLGEINLDTGVITFAEEKEIKDTEITATFTQDYASFGINTHTSKGEVNETIFMTGTDTLNSVIRKVNESSAGVTMFYDSFTDQVTLTRKETGKFGDGEKDIQVNGDFMTNILNFDNQIVDDGQNAKFTINGLETERSSNTFDMSGVTITLKQTFGADSNQQAATISVGNDTEQVFENIKQFVEDYNALIKEISDKINEPLYRDYKPLTDDEREELSEKQQEKWEEMARSGLLKGDMVLSGVLSSMRMDMYSTVETNGIFKQLASIGIKTTANYLEGGKLEIDEAKLKAALEEDPESVENLFRGNDSEAGKGIVHRLYDTVDASMKKLQEKAGRATSTNQQFTLGRELISVDKSIDRFEDKLKLTEERYWRQFTAMERAIQQANQQSAYLMQQFGGY